MTNAEPGERPGLAALTGLRFLAAMGVLGFHYYCGPCEPHLPAWVGQLLGAGFTTVSLFFILSGFILAYTYLDATGNFRGALSTFARARFARLYPIYFVALVVELPFFIRSTQLAAPKASAVEVCRHTVATLTLTQSWGMDVSRPIWNIVAWTLSVEAFFYAVFPRLGPSLGRLRARSLLAVAAGAWLLGLSPHAAPLAESWLSAHDAPALLRSALSAWSRAMAIAIPLARLPEFVIGVCLGVLFLRAPQPAGSPRTRTLGVLVTGLALAIAVSWVDGPPSPFLQSAVLVPLFALLIFLLAGGVAWRGLGLATRGLAVLGGASYALYMTHGAVLNSLLALNTRSLGLGHNTVALLAMPCAVLLSVVLFRFIEEPARAWLRRPRASLAVARPAVPASTGD
ncbi:acyltransferase [Myxococcaceae bacterium JPH2]|nr:acyltransferase [Myxococcaceae bacterium JPH2]